MRMKQNVIRDLSFQFSLKILDLYKHLLVRKEFILSKQLLRSATSIGANIEEAIEASSKKEFIHKMIISLKEAKETRYWLKLLAESKLVDLNYTPYLNDIEVLISILVKIVKTSRENLARA